ncbi:MAG: PKD domain-containing protein [Bacteroidetes bacterium]|nr:PKD domain-containing protein [Bacteroidota bacterium]
MNEFEYIFKFVGVQAREILNKLILIVGVLMTLPMFSVAQNSTPTNYSHDHVSENDIINDLENYFADNLNSAAFWDNIKLNWSGRAKDYVFAREKLIGFLYEQESAFMDKCIANGKIDPIELQKFKEQVLSASIEKLHSYRLVVEKSALFGPIPVPSPIAPECDNLTFDKCDFSNWQMLRGNVDGTPFGYVNIVPSALSNINYPDSGMQHSIIITPALDPIVPIQQIKPGRTCSAMVGDGKARGGKAASLRRTFAVTNNNYNFYYSYAVVLQNPGHNFNEQPYFRVRLKDPFGNYIDCASYDVYGGNGDPKWQTIGTGANTVNYMDWTSAFIPLQAYIGQNLTIEFTTGDCSRGGHYGYAYVEGECNIPTKLSDTATCVGKPVTITAPAGAKTYLWSTGATTASLTTELPGEYWVRMEGTAGGCFAYDTIHIGTYAMSTANFTVDSACFGKANTFTDKSFPANTITAWKWDYLNTGVTGSTSKNSANTYAAAGSFSAKLTVTNKWGCVDDTVRTVFVAPKPVADFSSTLTCKNDSTLFTDLSTGTITSRKWDFYNNGTNSSALKNPKFLYPNQIAASAKLKVTSDFGCVDSIIHPIVYHPMPVASFTQTNVCFPSAMNFNSTSTVSAGSINQSLWNFGDTVGTASGTSASYTYVRYGSRNVKLKVISDQNCVDSITKAVTVFEKPKMIFAATNICKGASAALNNSSALTSSATFATWQWDVLNDGSIEYTTKNASHLFANAGTYRILLKGITSETCWDTLSKSLTVYPQPTAKFISTIKCKGNATSFTDQSTGTISTWKWDFDNNGTIESSVNSPTYIYPSHGNFSAKLKITSDKGCMDSITKNVLVNPLPVAAFSNTTVCNPLPVQFTNASTVNPGSIKSTKWSFENKSSDLTNPTNIFSTHGNYNVKLLVLSDSGCADSITKPVTYYEKPVAKFTVNDECSNNDASFVNTSTVSTSSITKWSWDIDANSTIDYTSQNSTHKFTTPGSKSIKLIVKTAQGCSDTISKTMTVYPLPLAAFTQKDTCVSDSAIFLDASTISSGNIASYKWNFGDGKSAFSKNSKHKFSAEGTYNVQLIVTSDKNCKDTISSPSNIWPLPSPDFSSEDVCLKEKNIFIDASSISNANSINSIVSYNWKFGDNQISTAREPEHSFDSPGSHPVQLILKSNHNCIDSIKKTVVIHPLPKPKFITSDPEGCASWCVDFNDSSTVFPDVISSYAWDFGDGSFSTSKNPKHCFENPGNLPEKFNISLALTSNFGCKNDTSIKNMITANPVAHADFSFTPEQLDENDNIANFTNESSRSNLWKWNFGDKDSSKLENPVHQYKIVGDYDITLIANNDYNCLDSITKTIKLKPIYSYYFPNAFTPNADGDNDIFYAYTYNIIEFKMYIFDRWGELLFTSYDVNQGWNGLYQGNLVQIDTYVYKAYLTDIFGKKHQEVGKVSCIR